jgi:hypothetical protein
MAKEINMTIRSKRHWTTGIFAGVLSATFAFAALPGIAHAEWHGDRRDDHRDWHHGDWHRGGYYRAPPVVYGGSYYAPPPVIYGAPGFGLNINIR